MVLEGITEPEIAVVIAYREGLALASDLMLTSFLLASDCANTIRSMAGTGMGPYGQVMKEIKEQACDFVFVDFVHENRNSNVDAHALAGSLISFDTGRHVWFLEPPFGICNSVDQVHQ